MQRATAPTRPPGAPLSMGQHSNGCWLSEVKVGGHALLRCRRRAPLGSTERCSAAAAWSCLGQTLRPNSGVIC